MSYAETLTAIIAKKCDGLIGAAAIIEPTFVARSICNEHKSGLSRAPEAEFWNHAGYLHVRREVVAYIQKRLDPSDIAEAGGASAQLLLPGYAHLLTHYVVTRGKTKLAVPIEQASDEELLRLARRMLATSKSLAAHHDEVVHYVNARRETRGQAS